MPVGAEAPEHQDPLLEAHRRLDAGADPHFALAGVPPPVPGSRRDGHLLSRPEGAFLSVEDEGDLPRPDLEVLGAVIMHMLATGDEAARLDGEVG